jgi:hypothetical protein
VLARSCINLVARSIGIMSAARSSVSSSGSCSYCSSPDAYRHSTAYGYTTINATAVDSAAIGATVVDANATNSNASSICEGVCRDSRDTHDADDSGCGERDNKSARHDYSLSQASEQSSVRKAQQADYAKTIMGGRFFIGLISVFVLKELPSLSWLPARSACRC